MKKHRLNVDMTPEGYKQLLSLQKKLKEPTLIGVVRKAFSALEMIVDHQMDGGKVVLKNPDGSGGHIHLI